MLLSLSPDTYPTLTPLIASGKVHILLSNHSGKYSIRIPRPLDLNPLSTYRLFHELQMLTLELAEEATSDTEAFVIPVSHSNST